MEKEQLERFRSLLEKRRQVLLATEAVSREAAKPVKLDQSSVGRMSRVDALQAQAMALEAARRKELQLMRIEAALRRIERGEYGLCRSCEEDIDVRRLEFDPSTPLCITCATKTPSYQGA